MDTQEPSRQHIKKSTFSECPEIIDGTVGVGHTAAIQAWHVEDGPFEQPEHYEISEKQQGFELTPEYNGVETEPKGADE